MNNSAEYIALSGDGSLWFLVAGVLVAVVLIGGFWLGSRRARERRVSTPAPGSQARRGGIESREGAGWSTPDARNQAENDVQDQRAQD
ncbi:DUF6479 family protein [Streptomyces sp. LaPpAH-108]|uniref:DUF6479 family protein n=1 Tax=Streptomyces sp. LaPpAH-108 TaxID=1155714 RepID=UPI00036367BC|nr:DUF6479 family protein [Streptomyces sp. LaPpAH-108]